MPLTGSDVRRSACRFFVWFLLTTVVPASVDLSGRQPASHIPDTSRSIR
jgi:hypothetical protein